ncbi:MAG: hypothetical protein HY823_13585 [Acidobacteria bacterium]|nr:hypothetical protein [Acidobacteriota bacterium]
MRAFPSLRVAACMALAFTASLGQEWDPAKEARGWARFDRDGSCVFFHSAGRRLVTWSRDLPLPPVDLSRLDGAPEFWTLDSLGNAWVVSGNLLQYVEKNGRLGPRVRLPGSVSDLTWDVRGFVLSYRAPEPYVEKREYKGGGLLWSWGTRPEGRDGGPALHRIELADNGDVLVTRGSSMTVDIVDGAKGRPSLQTAFSWKGAVAPDLNLTGDRAPLASWLGKNVIFSAVPGRQAPHAGMNGMLLARLDLGSRSLQFLPTGLGEDFSFVGIFEDQAVFLSPQGGLAFAAIQ